RPGKVYGATRVDQYPASSTGVDERSHLRGGGTNSSAAYVHGGRKRCAATDQLCVPTGHGSKARAGGTQSPRRVGPTGAGALPARPESRFETAGGGRLAV